MTFLPEKISIIIPVYNVEKYLPSCLNSCINQTLYDIEIICVNDGSTDNSLGILEQYASVDQRIKIFSQKNSGLSAARNTGIEHARGEFFLFLDSDDYLTQNACERVWLETLEAPTDIVIFGTYIFPEIPRASKWYYDTLRTPNHRYWKFAPEVLFDEPGAKPFVWRQAYNRKFFEQYGLRFDERVRYGEDMVFQMEAFPHGKNFCFISDELYRYRWIREGSLMQGYRTDLDNKIRQHLNFIGYITKYWDSQGWLKCYGKEYTRWLLEFLVYDIRKQEVQCASEHLNMLNELLKQYRLISYLNEMPYTLKLLVKTVKRGKV